jgi:hypothetical protein
MSLQADKARAVFTLLRISGFRPLRKWNMEITLCSVRKWQNELSIGDLESAEQLLCPNGVARHCRRNADNGTACGSG